MAQNIMGLHIILMINLQLILTTTTIPLHHHLVLIRPRRVWSPKLCTATRLKRFHRLIQYIIIIHRRTIIRTMTAALILPMVLLQGLSHLTDNEHHLAPQVHGRTLELKRQNRIRTRRKPYQGNTWRRGYSRKIKNRLTGKERVKNEFEVSQS